MICPHCGKHINNFVTAKQIIEMKCLRKQGYSLREIAAIVETSFSTVKRYLDNDKKDNEQRNER